MQKAGVVGRFFLVAILSMVVFVIDSSGLGRGVRGYLDLPMGAVKGGIFHVYLFADKVASWQRSAEEVSKLKGELALDGSLLAQVATLSAENKALKAQLGVRSRGADKLLIASPIGFASGELFLDVGTSDGVALGDSVVLGQAIVGVVTSVSSRMTRVRTPIFEGGKVEVVVRSGGVDGVRRASGVVTAQGGQLVLDKVVLGEPLVKGDLVMTVGGGFARDLLVGTVGEIVQKDNQLFKKALVEPAIDYGHLDRVFVVLTNSK